MTPTFSNAARGVVILCWFTLIGPALAQTIDFRRDIEPLLAERCHKCHGEEKQKGGLRVDVKAAAIKGGDSGDRGIVPGHAGESRLFQMVASKKDDERMPPKGEPLDAKQIDLLKRWIEAGAEWPEAGATAATPARSTTKAADADRPHWSFQPLRSVGLPAVNDKGWGRTPVDLFIRQAQESKGLSPSAPADARTLVRRIYFDLIGLPPTPEELLRWTARISSSREAVSALVDELLASPHYGERWGRHWLDVAGWAESSLIVGDFVRPDFWRYRDYVIEAFNKDKPFDQFVVEQLAGDELVDWREAETLSPEMIEKLVATGFLRCAADGTDNQLITQMEKRYDTQQAAVEVSTKALLGLTTNCVRCHDHKYDPITQKEYYGLVAIFQPAYDPQNWVPGNINTFGAGPVRAIPILDRAGREAWARHCDEVYAEQAELLYQIDYGIENTFRDRFISEHLEEFETARRAALRKALRHEERKRSKEETALVFAAATELGVNNAARLREIYPEMNQKYKTAQTRMTEHRKEFNSSLPGLIWGLWDVSTDPSPTPLLTRGDYSKPAHPVEPGVIAALDSSEKPWSFPQHAPTASTTGRRLAFAKWLTRPDHPLTARVMANRIWQYHFGKGIVPTPDDFGGHGARPSHPELLDWLAVEFVENGWSIKHLHRVILNSATYGQAGGSTGDPAFLSGFPRRRLESEIIRDHMLAVSGLLDPSRGGESVPAVESGAGTWSTDPQHAGRHRRSVYMSTQRSRLPAILKVFDGPVMETNWPERTASAVAPQSLILMNHPFVIENAAALAKRIENYSGDNSDRLRFAWQLAYGRDPLPEEYGLIEKPLASEAAGPDWEVVAHALLSSNEFLYID